MIEKIVLDFLNSKGFSTYCEEENNMPKEYVLIDKTGGGGDSMIRNATIAIQSFSISKVGASELNEKIIEAMLDITELDDICRCELNSDYDYTDTARKKYRYQAVFDITYYC